MRKRHTGHTRQVEQRNMFYPYGASRADCWSDSAMEQRWKYSGKELDSFQGLHCYDYGFRWYDPIVCRWTTPDPMREKYYDISAYAYCGDNPINNIDRFGNDWVSSKFGNELFVYYDSKISSQEDIVNIYYNGERRKHYDINYVGKDGIIYEGTENGKEVRYHLLADGKYSDSNGTIITHEVSLDGYLHLGSDMITKDKRKNKHNIYGIYLGGNNPNDGNKDIYSIPPIDMLDYAAFLHDKGYDSKNASGPKGVLLNTSVYRDDFDLSVRAFNEVLTSRIGTSRWFTGFGTALLFGPLSIIKRDLYNITK